jgi:hypothetical protein
MFRMSFKPSRWLAAGILSFAASLGTFVLTGCERKERVVDIETPGADVEVDRNIDTGEVEVNANEN